MTELVRQPQKMPRRLLWISMLIALAACAKPVDAPPASITFFTPFSTDLDGPARQVLDQVVADARASPGRAILVEGYADRTTTTPAQNKTIAEQRAQAVADALVARGVDRSRIVLRPRLDVKADPGIESRRVDISFAR